MKLNSMHLFKFFEYVLVILVIKGHCAWANSTGPVKVPESSALAKTLSKRAIWVWEPHEDKSVLYSGFKIKDVLDKIFGPKWRQSELVLFNCADGYQSPVPTVLLQSEEGVLAYERTGSPFTVSNRFQNEKNVSLAPYYLVWNNLKSPQLRAEEASRWPYQVVGLELAKFSTKFAKMIPPKDSSQNVMKGFVAFQNYCMSCHKINGDGGEKGPALVSEMGNLMKEKNADWLAKWIADPSSIRPSTMPPLKKNIKDRDQVITSIISYLQKMSSVQK